MCLLERWDSDFHYFLTNSYCGHVSLHAANARENYTGSENGSFQNRNYEGDDYDQFEEHDNGHFSKDLPREEFTFKPYEEENQFGSPIGKTNNSRKQSAFEPFDTCHAKDADNIATNFAFRVWENQSSTGQRDDQNEDDVYDTFYEYEEQEIPIDFLSLEDVIDSLKDAEPLDTVPKECHTNKKYCVDNTKNIELLRKGSRMKYFEPKCEFCL